MILFFHNLDIFWVIWSVVFILFFVYIQHLVYKRKHYHSQPTEYTPPKDINPLLAGYLIDGHFHIRDYIAGYVYLIQQKVIDVDKQEPKKAIFNGKDLVRAEVYIENIAFKEGYVEKGLSFYKASFIYGSLFTLMLFGLLFYIKQVTVGNFDLHFISGLYIFLSSLPFSIYLAYKIAGLSKMKLTAKGRKAKNSLVGFKKFLESAESDRLNYFNSPKSHPDNFMEYLPYAIALGVDENWNFKYAGILSEIPSWYSPSAILLPKIPHGINGMIGLIDVVQRHKKIIKK